MLNRHRMGPTSRARGAGLAVLALATVMPVAGPWVATASAASLPSPKGDLLTLSDLPSGWKSAGSVPTTGGTGSGCGEVEPTMSGTHAAASAGGSFDKGQDEGVEELIYAYTTPAKASAAWAKVDARLNGCHSYSQQGTKLKVTPVDFPTYAQRTAAWAITGTIQSHVLTDEPVVVLQGRELAFVAYANVGRPTVSQVEPFVKAAAARLHG